jgi:hypothetical protein
MTIITHMVITMITTITTPTQLQTLMLIWGNITNEFGRLLNQDERVTEKEKETD